MPKHPKGVKQRKAPEKGNKKKYRGKKMKKGQRGEVTLYITRSKAVRKLGLTLKDFRRVCILKGIYPREPNKKFEGQHRTYYHKKDIKYLALDPILPTLRALKIYKRKYRKAMKQDNKIKMKNIKKIMPKYSLNMIIKERYPTFIDAVRDLDDPLCLLNLFASLPSHRVFKIPPQRLANCLKLKTEFNSYVIKTRSLRKVFLSIKGIYYQAEIKGQKILWLDPYNFAQKLPYDVDYRVMMTFLEFYEVLLKFIMFKLYTEANMTYPPLLDMKRVEDENFSYEHLEIRKLNVEGEDQQDEKYKVSEEFMQDEKVQQIFGERETDNDKFNMFEGFTFFLSNEVPREPMEIMIMSFGGKVMFDAENFESYEYKENEGITHVVTDRDPKFFDMRQDRDYIQPQWICDSINEGTKLPIGDYKPGRPLPPHLSPFIDDKTEGYLPDRRKELDKIKGQEAESSEEEEESSSDEFEQEEEIVVKGSNGEAAGEKIDIEGSDDEEESEDDEEEDETAMVEEDSDDEEEQAVDAAEGQAAPYAQAEVFDYDEEEKIKEKQEKKKSKEIKKLSKVMLTKKKKRILHRINYGKNQKKMLVKKLKARKQQKKKQSDQN